MKKQMQLQNRHSPYLVVLQQKCDNATLIIFISTTTTVTRMKLPATDMYPHITKLIFDEWQEVSNCCAGNKVHAIRPTVGDYKQKTCLSRRDAALLNRLCIGHTRLTHSFLLSGDDLPECGTCQCSLKAGTLPVSTAMNTGIKFLTPVFTGDIFDAHVAFLKPANTGRVALKQRYDVMTLKV